MVPCSLPTLNTFSCWDKLLRNMCQIIAVDAVTHEEQLTSGDRIFSIQRREKSVTFFKWNSQLSCPTSDVNYSKVGKFRVGI